VWVSWPKNPATCASAHALVYGRREEGGTNKAGPRCRESKGDTRGNGSAAGEPDPQNREREGERAGEGKLAPIGWSHWATRERGRVGTSGNCR
jgi:hypothetical protein